MLKSLFDKIFFALGVILFLQLPHFIDQYTQRMGGYAASQQQQIREYQVIADQHFNGDIQAYVERLEQHNDPAVSESAEQINKRLKNAAAIEKELMVYEQQALWYQVPYFVAHIRLDLAKGTAQNFAPGLPINLWAWGYGLMGGLLFSLLFNGVVKLPGTIRRKAKQKSSSKAH